jgi:hypothetical protein
MAERTRRAATLGSDVPRGPLSVRIHSVFHAAVNLRAAGGGLFTLLSAEAPDGPRAVRLDSAEDFVSLGLAAGAFGAVGADSIALVRPAGRPPFRVDCAGARRLAVEAPPPLHGDSEQWRGGVALLDALQARAAADLRVAPLFDGAPACGAMSERLTRAARDLGEGVRAGSLEGARAAAARLVGLGPGLTPAGDDFLCGFVVAARCRAAARPARAPLLARFAGALGGLLDRTTDLSAAFLGDAIAGRAFRPLAALAEACAGAPGSDVNGAILRLAAIGHSSGLDAATGFFYGAAVWS